MQSLDIARQLATGVGWKDADFSDVDIRDTGEPLATDWPIGQIAAGALAATGSAANAIAHLRGCGGPVGIDTRAAALAMCANDYLRVDGEAVVEWPALTGFYRAADGWVFLHRGFPEQGRRLLAALDAPEDREGVVRRLSMMDAAEIESRALEANVCARRLRSREEWLAHPAAKAVTSTPLLSFDDLGAGAPSPWTPAEKPLAGVRVLDLSRVLAGPTIGRTLAEHGAEVLRVSAPHLPFSEALTIDTGYGKRAAHVDLETEEGRHRFAALVRDADVLIDGFRPGALDGRGFDIDTLAELRPGLIVVSLSAFGETGPWGGQRGYDSLVQATTGLAKGDPPRRLPCQPLDYLAGYLGAFSAMRALANRAETGRGAIVRLSLAGMAQFLIDLREDSGRAPMSGTNPGPEDIPDELTSLETPFGRVTALRPALDVAWRPRTWQTPPRIGSDAAEWRSLPAS